MDVPVTCVSVDIPPSTSILCFPLTLSFVVLDWSNIYTSYNMICVSGLIFKKHVLDYQMYIESLVIFKFGEIIFFFALYKYLPRYIEQSFKKPNKKLQSSYQIRNWIHICVLESFYHPPSPKLYTSWSKNDESNNS